MKDVTTLRQRSEILKTISRWVKAFQTRYTVTAILVFFLILWYEIQLLAVGLFDPPKETIQYWFTMRSITHPTPGWLFAPISHAFPPKYSHLIGNVGIIAVFGGLAERHLSPRSYLAFFIVTGFLGAALHTANVNLGGELAAVKGASAAAYGLMFYSTYHIAQQHDDELLIGKSVDTGAEWMRIMPRFTYSWVVLLVPIWVALHLLMKLTGILSAGDVAVDGHATGALLGVCFVYFQPVMEDLPCWD